MRKPDWHRPYALETDWLAGHVRFELRNVVANYPFESSRGFPGSEPNCGHGDHSRLSCSAGIRSSGLGSAGVFSKRSARTLRRAASPRRHELAAGFLSPNKGKLKKNLPFFIGGEDCFCTRESAFGPYGALDRQAILNADLALMMAEGPAIIADHGFTTGKIAQVSSEKPLQPSREKAGIINGFGCFPDKMSPPKNTGTFIPDDFEHEIGTNFLVKGKGLVILTSCSHRGIINTIRQAQAVSGIKNV